MRTLGVRSVLSLLFASAWVGSATAQYAMNERVNVGALGVAADAESSAGGMTPDGRFVTFASRATNLLPVPSGSYELFLLDRQTQQLEIVSQSSAGVAGNDESHGWSISADGRYVAFSSLSNNLVAGDTNGKFDSFVRDRQLGLTTRVSVSAGGVQGNGNSWRPYIADDGRSVVFSSLATNLAPGAGLYYGVYFKDLVTGQVRRLDLSPTGAPPYDNSWWLTASGDGRLVAYSNASGNLVSGDTNGQADIFVTDTQTGATQRVSISSSGAQADFYCNRPVISRDGSTVAFESVATNLVSGDVNNVSDVFVHQLADGITERVSLTNGGIQLAWPCQWAQISGDGRFVAFECRDAYVVPGDNNNEWDIFIYDRVGQRVTCASLGWYGQFVYPGIQGLHFVTALSGDGRYVLFDSQGANIVQGDTNHITDVFFRDWLASTGPLVFCPANASSTGCTPQISATANPSATFASTCTLSVVNVDAVRTALFFYGIDNSGFAWQAWHGGTSVLCVRAPRQRTPLQNSGGTLGTCNGSIQLDWNQFQQTHPGALGSPWLLGQRIYAQAWYRDPGGTPMTALTNALELVAQP